MADKDTIKDLEEALLRWQNKADKLQARNRELQGWIKENHIAGGVRRRDRVDRLTPAELAIRNAMLAVEEVGADVLLTDAVNLLEQAKNKVADYVDKTKLKSLLYPEAVNEEECKKAGTKIQKSLT